MDIIKCSCGADVPRQVLEIGLCKYSCSKSVKQTPDGAGGRVSTVFFPHLGIYHGAETGFGEYETIHFSADGRVLSQVFLRDEADAILYHDKIIKYAKMFASEGKSDANTDR